MDPASETIATSFAVGPQGDPTNGSVHAPKHVLGYEGWWNATPVNGNTTGLPQETVAVNTDTGTVVDGYNRATQNTHISYTVKLDPDWPKDSIVIIDTGTNNVIDSFPIAPAGNPTGQ
jgi:hypothetical protein